MTRCTCERARREARAEAFAEAAEWHAERLDFWTKAGSVFRADVHSKSNAYFADLAAEAAPSPRPEVYDLLGDLERLRKVWATRSAIPTEWAGQDGGLDG